MRKMAPFPETFGELDWTWILKSHIQPQPEQDCLTVCLHLAAIPAHDVPEASRKNKLEKEVEVGNWHAPGPRRSRMDAGLISHTYLSAVQHPGLYGSLSSSEETQICTAAILSGQNQEAESNTALHLAQKAPTIIGTDTAKTTQPIARET